METIELAYDVYEHGTDPDKNPIILIHGFFWNKYMLEDIARSLSRATKRKVYSLDLRCHDKSEFREERSSEIMTEDIKRFMNDRKLEKVVFICHSYSCTLAYLVTLDMPDRVEKLVMVDHPPFLDTSGEMYKTNVYPQFAAQDRFLRTLDPSLTLSEAKAKFLKISKAAESEGQKVFLQKCAYELLKEDNKFKWKTNHQALIDGYLQNCIPPPRGRSDHEILIIRCINSTRVTDEKFQAVLKYNPNAKMVTMENTTHLLMFENTEEFIEIVKNFLS